MFEYMDQSKIFVAFDLFFPEFRVALLFFGHFSMMFCFLLMLLFDFFLHHDSVWFFKGDPVMATNLQPDICFSLWKIFLFFCVFFQE